MLKIMTAVTISWRVVSSRLTDISSSILDNVGQGDYVDRLANDSLGNRSVYPEFFRHFSSISQAFLKHLSKYKC
jgi:hypothetical protein